MPGTEDYFVSRSKKAQRACQLCSATKVRCIAEAGSPCHNCTRRGWKCETDQRIRRKRRVHPKSSGFIPKVPSQNWPSVGMGAFAPPSIPTPPPLPTNDGFDSPPGIPDLEGQAAFSPFPLQPWAAHELTPPESPEEELWDAFTHLSSEQLSSSEEYSTGSLLPGFVKPLQSSMDPTMIDYLHSNGVLSLPSLPLQNALLQAFAECVLPTMPIVEWQTFLNAINHQESGHSSISLLLFHAVMFSATTFVGTEHLLEAGFLNRREAHDALFQKVQLLYQTNYEADPITAVQALLLMTYRVDTADGHDSRHRIKVAISMASSIGIFSDLFTPTTLPCSPRLWKRIAWTCYMMDSQIALRLRYRPIIHRASFSHSMLTEDDFDLSVSNPDNDTAPTSSMLPSLETQRDLANICIANARLCLTINEILQFRGKDDPPFHTSGTPSSPSSTTSDDPDHAARVSTCEMELAAWANSLPHSCHAPSLEMNRFDDDPVVVVQRSLLHMVFYTAVAILHQVQPFPSSKFCVKYAAHQITVIASELHRRNLHTRLSIVGVTGALVALIIHISELKGQSSKAEESFDHCRLCVDVIADLRDVYWEADNVTTWALGAFEKTRSDTSVSWTTIDDVQDDWIEINA